MNFDKSTVFVLVLTAIVIVAIALMNIYGRDPKNSPSSGESATGLATGKPPVPMKTRKKARKR